MMHARRESTNWRIDTADELGDDLWRMLDSENERVCGKHPLLDSRFVRPLLQYFPADVLVAHSYTKRQRAALLLLVRESPWRIVGYRPYQSQLALAIVDPRYQLDFGEICRVSGVGTLRMDLSAIDPKYQSGLIKRAPDRVYSVRATNIVIKADGSFEAYWQSRPRKMRKNVERQMRRLERDDFNYEFAVTTEPGAIDLAVARYGMLESQGWKGKTGTALHPGNDQGRFYSDVLTNFSRTGGGLVMELRVGERVVASRLLIRNDALVIALKTTYDEGFSAYGIGRVLLYEMVKYFFDRSPGVEIDFYTDATKDQIEWSTSEREIETASFYRTRVACTLAEAALHARRGLAPLLRRTAAPSA